MSSQSLSPARVIAEVALIDVPPHLRAQLHAALERLAVLEARVIEARDELKEEYGQLCAYGTPKYDHGAGYAAALERVGKMFAAILKGSDQ